jgi:hypothetical protein
MPFQKSLSLSISFIPLAIFIYCLIAYTINLPWLDDFEVGPYTLQQWLKTTDIEKKMDLIWVPNNEHRVIILKLLVLFNYYVFGQINIQWMIWQSHLYLIPLLYLIFKVLPEENRWISFAVINLIYLSFQYSLASYWMIAAVQHNTVIGFGLISMFLLSKNKYLGLSIFFTFLACLSNSDGLFFIPIGTVILLLQFNLKKIIIWLLILTSLIYILFKNYPSWNYHANAFQFFIENPSKSFFGFFYFLGGYADFFNNNTLPIRLYTTGLFGLILVLFWGKLLYEFSKGSTQMKLKSWKNGTLLNSNVLFTLSGILFCLTNALAISVLRSEFGEYAYLIGNYRIYPVLAIAFTCLMYFQQTHSYRKMLFISLMAIIFWGFSFKTYIPEIINRKKYMMQSYLDFKSNKDGLGFTAKQIEKYKITEILNTFEKKGIYHPPKIK